MKISRPIRAGAPALAVLLVLGLGACGTTEDTPGGTTEPTSSSDAAPTTGPADDVAPTTDDEDATTERPTVDPTEGAALPTGPVPTSVLAQDNVKAAIADLAQREGVDEGAVTAAGYLSVTWRDGSIGCPKPGMMYTQALVPGHLLVLEVDGELFSYHAGQKDTFNYCANPSLPPLDETM